MIKPVIQGFLGLMAYSPLWFHYRFAHVIAFVFRVIPNRFTRQTRQNIALCLPELDASEQDKLYRQVLIQTAYMFTELASVWHGPVEKIFPRITSTDICEEFQHTDRAKIVLAPHLGSWETLGIWLGQHCDAIILYKRLKDKGLDDYICKARGRTGGTPVSTRKRGLRKLLIGLREKDTLMILPDQKPGAGKARIKAEFFGVSAPTTTLVRNLCGKVDCDVYIATMCRSSPPGEFSLIIRALDRERLTGDEIASAQYMNDEIEQLVRKFPQQYHWSYRRFSNKAYGPAK